MTESTGYLEEQPGRADIDALTGPALLVFGTDWCGHCRIAERPMGRALTDHPGVQVIRAEDGPGRPLGRSFGVKLWPTLIFLRDGQEVSRLVRPTADGPIAEALAEIDGS
ncbi:thioredoxin family protein [Gordonia hirsuta]|nr:thioredoxin family protein [Gordonia hirsuta]